MLHRRKKSAFGNFQPLGLWVIGVGSVNVHVRIGFGALVLYFHGTGHVVAHAGHIAVGGHAVAQFKGLKQRNGGLRLFLNAAPSDLDLHPALLNGEGGGAHARKLLGNRSFHHARGRKHSNERRYSNGNDEGREDRAKHLGL